MKIHAIQTGTVAVTRAWREGVGHGRRRLLHAILDREWTEPLPIYAFAIEHPEGVIVVDTGETPAPPSRATSHAGTPASALFASGSRRSRRSARSSSGSASRPGDVRWVVMTHLHTDHAGGLHHFPDNEILVTRDRAGVRVRPARPPARLRREQALAGLVQPNRARARAGAARSIPAEPAPDGSGRRHARAGSRPHPWPDRRARRRGRPHRLPCWRQLLHAGADAARRRSTASEPTRRRNGSHTSGFVRSQRRLPPSTWSRTTPTREPVSPSGGSSSTW